MQPERPLPRTPRLGLVFRGAGSLWTIPASSILEVAPPPPLDLQGEARTRSGLLVEDLAALLGEPRADGPKSVALVLDCAPPRAFLVDGVEEVTDLSAAPFFGLPVASETGMHAILRGAVLHKGRLLLELVPQALADFLAPGSGPAARPLPEPGPGANPPARALVFEAAEGTLFGIPLPLVTGVLRPEARCHLPLAPIGHVGLVHHERTLLPVYDLSRMSGGPPTQGELVVAMDVGGAAIGVAARSVVGVLDGLSGEGTSGPAGPLFRTRDGRPVWVPELERWMARSK